MDFKTFAHFTSAAVLLTTMTAVSACSDRSGAAGWSIETKNDPMRDVAITSATTRLSGENADLELVVGCGSSGEFAYQFRTFDKSGEPLDVRAPETFGPAQRRMLVRLDSGKLRTVIDFSSPYTNQILLGSPQTNGFAKAEQIIARMPLVNGTETYTIDQRSADFRRLAQPCIEKAEAERQRVLSTPMTVFSEPAPSAPQPSPTATQCWTPPSGPHVLDDPNRAISAQEVEEIESVTGRPYQEGDSIYGRAEDRCPQ